MSTDGEVPRRVFEGLFAGQDCALTAERTRALLGLGYDVEHPSSAYPHSVWSATVEYMRREVVPTLSEPGGRQELGRRFAEGLGRTPVGWVFRQAAQIFGPDHTLLSVPRYLHVVRRSMKVVMIPEGERRYRMLADDADSMPDFIAGCLWGILDVFSLDGRADVVNVSGAHFEVVLTWDVKR